MLNISPYVQCACTQTNDNKSKGKVSLSMYVEIWLCVPKFCNRFLFHVHGLICFTSIYFCVRVSFSLDVHIRIYNREGGGGRGERGERERRWETRKMGVKGWAGGKGKGEAEGRLSCPVAAATMCGHTLEAQTSREPTPQSQAPPWNQPQSSTPNTSPRQGHSPNPNLIPDKTPPKPHPPPPALGHSPGPTVPTAPTPGPAPTRVRFPSVRAASGPTQHLQKIVGGRTTHAQNELS